MKRLVCGVNEADPGNDSLFAAWQQKLHAALEYTSSISDRPGILIEVAAQHPLVDGKYPNKEFAERLDSGLELYRQYRRDEPEVKIYVPGSVHMDNGVPDNLSLSSAGCTYLLEHGVSPEDLIGDDANAEFKGEQGVYNSSDECYVASCLLKKLGFGELHCVCSPAQLLRKALSYIEFGLVPKMHSVSCDEMFHSYVDEAFLFIPRLLADGSGLQGESMEADRLRAIRKPR